MPSIILQEDKQKLIEDNVKGARAAFTIINQITNSLRREPADTQKLKRANESMEFHLRSLEQELEDLEENGEPVPYSL